MSLDGGFFVGLHQPSDAKHFTKCCVSVNRLRARKSDFVVGRWIMDSGAFTEISRYGGYRDTTSVYARHIRRWSTCGQLLCAVSQDWMCEPFILDRTGLTVREHQRRTIQRYDDLVSEDLPVYLMPVLQGYAAHEYVDHIDQYGDRLAYGAWVGVGSVCKRNASVSSVVDVLGAIHDRRPDLRTHGFGLKLTALSSDHVRDLLWSADSMAWSFAARRQGRNPNNWKEAKRFCNAIEQAEWHQRYLFV